MQNNDLIFRAAAIKEIESIRYCGDFISALIHLPAVDAVPVVRCKDCKYAHLTIDDECKYCDMISVLDDEGNLVPAYFSPNWYCAYGERKDDV